MKQFENRSLTPSTKKYNYNAHKHSLDQCFLTFFGFVYPCHRLLHYHSPHCESCPMWQ